MLRDYAETHAAVKQEIISSSQARVDAEEAEAGIEELTLEGRELARRAGALDEITKTLYVELEEEREATDDLPTQILSAQEALNVMSRHVVTEQKRWDAAMEEFNKCHAATEIDEATCKFKLWNPAGLFTSDSEQVFVVAGVTSVIMISCLR